MTIKVWTFEQQDGKKITISSEDKYVIEKEDIRLEVPVFFEISSNGPVQLYGYIDHSTLERSKDLNEGRLVYITRKCAMGMRLLENDGQGQQGIILGESGGYKIKIKGDIRLYGYNILKHKQDRVIIFDGAFLHDSQQEKDFHKRKKLAHYPEKITYEERGEEAKDDGGHYKAAPVVQPGSLIRYALAYDSKLLESILDDEEFTAQITGESNDGISILHLLTGMLDATAPGGRYIDKTAEGGVTLDNWQDIFEKALLKVDPRALTTRSIYDLLDSIHKSQETRVLSTLNTNNDWKGYFWNRLRDISNPLKIFFKPPLLVIDGKLFKTVVDINPRWLLGGDAIGNSYFKQLAIYLKTHPDLTLQSVIISNLPLLQGSDQLEDLTLHLLKQEPFDLKHCEYLGLRTGFTRPFNPSTNKLIVLRIRAAESLEDKLYLLEFFSPCLGPNGKSVVLQHLIEPSTINTCDQAVIKLFDEISSDLNLFAARSKQYLDNNGNNWQIYNKFLEHPESKQFQHAPKLLEKLITLEGGNINDCNQEKVWSLFKEEQGGIFVENFGHYLNRGGNDWRVYNKFLEEFKGDLSPYAPKLFIILVASGEEKLLMKFTSTGVDLTQAIEELKSGKLKLPNMTKASSAKLESLSKILRVSHALTTVDILFLMEKSNKEIVDFCLTEGNEDLKVAILRVYQDRLPWPTKIMQDSFSRALGILPILAPEHILQLTKTTTGRQVIDFCKEHAAYPVFEILKAYAYRFHDVKLSPDEIIMFALNKETASLLACAQIKEVGYQNLFKILQMVENPADLACNLFTNGPTLSTQDLDELIRNHPWARQFAGSLKMHQTSHPDVKVNFRVTNGALTFDTDSNSQGSSIFNSNIASKLIRGVNGVSTAFDLGTESIKFAEEPSLVRILGVTANLLLLICVIRPGSTIAHKRLYIQILAKAPMDIQEHGMLDAIINLVSNLGTTYLGALESLSLPPYPKVLYGIGASAIGGCYRSAMRFFDAVAPYFTHKSNESEQCEVLLFLWHKYDQGSPKAILDNLDELIARGYYTFLLDEVSDNNAEAVIESFTDLIEAFKSELETVTSYSLEEKLLQEDIINDYQARKDLLLRIKSIAGTSIHNVNLLKDDTTIGGGDLVVQEANRVCRLGPKYRKQVFLADMGFLSVIPLFKKSGFNVLSFAVFDTKEICDNDFQSSLISDYHLEGIKNDCKLYKCKLRDVTANEFTTDANEKVVSLNSYKNPRLNITAEIFKRIDPSAQSSRPRKYSEMTPTELKEAEMVGNEELQYSLGNQFVKNNKLHLAEQWYRRAAVGGHVEAKTKLATILSAKPGLSTDPEGGLKEARRWAQEAVNEGSIDGHWILGKALEYQDDNLLGAEKLYRKAAEKGHEGAKESLEAVMEKILIDRIVQHDLGVRAKRKGNLDEAEDWFRKSAEQGFGKSQYELAVLLFDKKNFVEAKIWAKKASDNDVPSGHFLLGSLLTYEDDFVAAKSLLLLSVDKGYEHAQDMITIVNQKISEMTSAGLNSSDSNSFALLQLASDGNMKAQHDMAAELLQKGKTQPAIYWYREAAKQEFPPSQTMLAVLLVESGNRPEAKKWAEKAANHGFMKGQETLGTMLKEDGDLAGAAKWYQKAVAQGSEDAPSLLAGVQLKILSERSEQESFFVKFDSGKDLSGFFLNSLPKHTNQDDEQVKVVEDQPNAIVIAGQDTTPYEEE